MNLKTAITYLIIVLIIPIVSIAQNKMEINIIPKPQSLSVLEGTFKITPNTVIIAPKGFYGEFLRNKIKGATKYNITVLCDT
ncbi:MAG: hypothetical protein RR770_00090 [Bacteroidales bacterium]